MVVLLSIVIGGCASTFKPSQNTIVMMNDMDTLQASEEIYSLMRPRNLNGNLSRSFITGHIGLGLCKASHLSLNEDKGPDLQVTHESISFNAVKTGALVRSTQQGRISSASGMSSINQYQKIPYRETFRFDKIDSVTIHEPSVLRTVCGRQKGQTEVVVRESQKRWYVALIPTEGKDRFIAALLRLRPDVLILNELPDSH